MPSQRVLKKQGKAVSHDSVEIAVPVNDGNSSRQDVVHTNSHEDSSSRAGSVVAGMISAVVSLCPLRSSENHNAPGSADSGDSKKKNTGKTGKFSNPALAKKQKAAKHKANLSSRYSSTNNTSEAGSPSGSQAPSAATSHGMEGVEAVLDQKQIEVILADKAIATTEEEPKKSQEESKSRHSSRVSALHDRPDFLPAMKIIPDLQKEREEKTAHAQHAQRFHRVSQKSHFAVLSYILVGMALLAGSFIVQTLDHITLNLQKKGTSSESPLATPKKRDFVKRTNTTLKANDSDEPLNEDEEDEDFIDVELPEEMIFNTKKDNLTNSTQFEDFIIPTGSTNYTQITLPECLEQERMNAKYEADMVANATCDGSGNATIVNTNSNQTFNATTTKGGDDNVSLHQTFNSLQYDIAQIFGLVIEPVDSYFNVSNMTNKSHILNNSAIETVTKDRLAAMFESLLYNKSTMSMTNSSEEKEEEGSSIVNNTTDSSSQDKLPLFKLRMLLFDIATKLKTLYRGCASSCVGKSKGKESKVNASAFSAELGIESWLEYSEEASDFRFHLKQTPVSSVTGRRMEVQITAEFNSMDARNFSALVFDVDGKKLEFSKPQAHLPILEVSTPEVGSFIEI